MSLFPQFAPLCYTLNWISSSIGMIGDMVEFIGKYFGKWLVVEDAGRDSRSNKIVWAECKCKKISLHRLKTLTSGDTTQCKSCAVKDRHNFVHLVSGLSFGKWIVLRLSEKKYKNTHYLCRCECGNEKDISSYNLRNGLSTACRKCRPNMKSHGMSYSSTYKIWRDMKNRCTRPKLKCYKNYGARGISVCDRWFKFENFLEDMGVRPDGLQIDRTDNDGNYEPKNCRWVTPTVNRNNQRNSKKKE